MRNYLIPALAAASLIGAPAEARRAPARHAGAKPAAADPAAPTPIAPAEKDYATELAKLRAGDLLVDLKWLRQQHAGRGETERWEQAKDQFAKLETAPEEALAAAQARLEQDWLTPEAHLLSEIALSRLSRKDETAKHHAFLLAWLRSVTGDRDGLTPATSWNAASVDEEYFALMLMGRKVDGQALVNGKDGVFDLMHTTDRKSGEKGDIWFDISSFFGKEFGLGATPATPPPPSDPAAQGR
jgi:hypothetical protein